MEPEFVVVGSGPAGIAAAWPLVTAGRRVLMLEAGRLAAPSPPFERPSLAQLRSGLPSAWRHLLKSDLSALSDADGLSPKLRSAMPAAARNAGYADANAIRVRSMRINGMLHPGGLSNVWGAVTTTFEPTDIPAGTIPWDALHASYRAVAHRIGIAAADDSVGLSPAAPIPVASALALSPLATAVLAGYRARPSRGWKLGPVPSAVLTAQLGGRLACHYCGGCMWGCSARAVYNAADDLAVLRRHPNLLVQDDSLVVGLSRDGSGYRLDIRAGDGERRHMRARSVLLAAGTFATTRLALALLEAFDRPFPVQHTPATAAAVLVPGMLGTALPTRLFGMAQLAVSQPLDKDRGEIFATLYDASSVSAADLARRLPLTTRGGQRTVRALLPALALMLVYFPGRFSRNEVRLARGAGGGPELAVQGGLGDDLTDIARIAMRTLGRNLRRAGAWVLPGTGIPLEPGADSHYGASLPIGTHTDTTGQLAGAPGVFIVDGACLPSLPARHHTFTIMANADRIGRALAARG